MPKTGTDPSAIDLLVESAVRTTSGDSGPTDGWSIPKTLRVQLDVTAVAGTSPTLDVVLEDSLDGTNWNTLATFSAQNTPGHQVVNVTTPFADLLRARWTIGGTTPSFTFSVLAYSE